MIKDIEPNIKTFPCEYIGEYPKIKLRKRNSNIASIILPSSHRNMQKHGPSSKLITLILLLVDTNYSFPGPYYKKASEQKKKCNQNAKKSTLFASLAVTGLLSPLVPLRLAREVHRPASYMLK